MKKILLIIALLVWSNLIAQNKFEKFDLLKIQANRAMVQTDYKEAINCYTQAFKYEGVGERHDYLNAAICAIKINDIDQAWVFLSDAISKTGVELFSLTTHTEFKDNEPLQRLIRQQHDSLYKVYFQNLPNLTAYLKVEDLMMRDQCIRKLEDYYHGITDEMKSEVIPLYMEAQKKQDTMAIKKYRAIVFPHLNDELTKYNLKIMKTIDSLNISELISITSAHGWQKNAWIMLWHQRGSYGENTPTWNFFKSAIDKEIAEGKLPKSFWAPFEDHKSIRATGFSKYGYHPGKVNAETVNINRQTIGLPALTELEIAERNENPRSGRMF